MYRFLGLLVAFEQVEPWITGGERHEHVPRHQRPDFRRDEEYWNTPAEVRPDNPYFGHDGVHEIYREWHALLEEYPGERILCAEAFVEPLTKMAKWVRPDEMQQAFNFPFLVTRWDGEHMRQVKWGVGALSFI